MTTEQLPRYLSAALTFVLWLATIVLGILELAVAVDVVLAAYRGVLTLLGVPMEDFGREYWTGYNIQTIGALVMGMGVLVMAIISGEIYLRHYGTPRAWKLAGAILGAELGLLVIGYFISSDAFYLWDLLFRLGG